MNSFVIISLEFHRESPQNSDDRYFSSYEIIKKKFKHKQDHNIIKHKFRYK